MSTVNRYVKVLSEPIVTLEQGMSYIHGDGPEKLQLYALDCRGKEHGDGRRPPGFSPSFQVPENGRSNNDALPEGDVQDALGNGPQGPSRRDRTLRRSLGAPPEKVPGSIPSRHRST